MEAWLRAHCPCAFDDPSREFYEGLLTICLLESERAVERERARAGERLRKPSDQ
jgi:hypothetical protein